MRELTPKQQRFVDEYLIDLNATQAAIRAGYSEKTANEQGARLLANVSVKAEIETAKQDRSERVNVNADYVLRRLFEMAEADKADLYDDAGNLLPVKDWPEVWRKGMVTGIEVNELFDGRGDQREQIGFVKKVHHVNTLSILQTLGKHISVNAFQDQVKVTGLDALADRMARARARK